MLILLSDFNQILFSFVSVFSKSSLIFTVNDCLELHGIFLMAYLTWAKFFLSTGDFILQSFFKWGSLSALIIVLCFKFNI